MSLTDLDIKHRIEIPLVGLGPAVPTTFPLTALGSPEFPWQLKSINGITVAGAAIVITQVAVNDELGNLIYEFGLLPWQFAGSTQRVNLQQGPEPLAISFLGVVIAGIPADFYVYSDWTLTVDLLNPLPGSSYDLTAICMEGFFRDKYRLSA